MKDGNMTSSSACAGGGFCVERGKKLSNGDRNHEVWQPDTLSFYLSVYYSDQPDWSEQLIRLRRKGKSQDTNRKHLGFTILAPSFLKIRPTTPPEALLFACFKFDGFDDCDWASKLEEVYDKDEIIKQRRKDFLEMGSIMPVEYHSRSRQALRWIFEEASGDSTITEATKPAVLNRLKSVVMIYGPSSICSLFQRVEIKASFLASSPNWRSGYFIEQALYTHFTFEQLQQMKQRDLDSAPDELIKSFGRAKEQNS